MMLRKDSGLLLKRGVAAMEIKSVADDGTFEGYGSVFGVVDSYAEVVKPGAFMASLAKRKARGVKQLWQHDPSQPIGVWDDLAEDSKGLWVKGRLLKDVSPRALEAYGLLKAGALDGLSIGYREVRTEPDKDRPGIVNLLELDLREISIVTFAANERARVETVKSDARALRDRVAAGDRLTEREMEQLLKSQLDLSNAEAERAVRLHFHKGQGAPGGTATDFLRALRG